ncbi:alpha-galactosidase [Oscillatoria laete-virens NRMC-F 0139]|nr:glycoside hydrolase family 36 protein [Oscillatoria laete-virens]MDL5055373.1 alpha-galactosidase [Oscillatoria laete-virens NRMC-F 0139]
MKEMLSLCENGLHIVIAIPETGPVRLLHFQAAAYDPAKVPEEKDLGQFYKLVELHVSGENQWGHHGQKHTLTSPGVRLEYVSHKDDRTAKGRKLEITQRESNGLEVTTHWQFFDGTPTIQAWNQVRNTGKDTQPLVYLSSFHLTGIAKEGLRHWNDKCRIHLGFNSWFGEAQFKCHRLPDLGLTGLGGATNRLSWANVGTWSSPAQLPLGYFENREAGTTLYWQIEHNASWHFEIGDGGKDLYLNLSGPTEQECHWCKLLGAGESFTSVPVGVGCVAGGLEEASNAFNQYRRGIRRPHVDNTDLPVIFNDYMNCLNGDPTTEKLLPLIDAAAEVGCEYFVIDCGWYSDGFWWPTVGEWLPSGKRFPGGIQEPIEYIRKMGMVPGLWLEPEVMGIECPLVGKVPEEWFFKRHGRIVTDHARYQLDFRNPEVIAHVNRVVDRLVKDYGVGYIKMDYNINGGIGTETNADSFGDGLLGHNRAFLTWLESLLERYPDLVIENCGSGGLRMDYAMLSRLSIQSTSDQTDYSLYQYIVSALPLVIAPEQGAVWTYPLRTGDREEAVFNMVNALLMRVHQSGHLNELTPERLALVREGLDYYKTYRKEIPSARAFWPTGFPSHPDPWVSLGYHMKDKTIVAVWRREGGSPSQTLSMPHLKGVNGQWRCAYPQEDAPPFEWSEESGQLTVQFAKEKMARIFEFTHLSCQ